MSSTLESRPAVFNPYAPGYDADPSPAVDALREATPITYWEQGRCWVLTRYEDIAAILADDQRFTASMTAWEFASSAGPAALVPELEEMSRVEIFTLPLEDHARVRKLVSPAFTPRAIERLRPDIQALVEGVLDTVAVAARDTLNLVTDFSHRIPAQVMMSLLKISQAHEARFHRFTLAWIKALLPGMLTPEEAPEARVHIREGIALIRETIEERRRAPRENDLLTQLIQAEEEGSRLSTVELMSLVASLIAGGFETSIHLLNFTCYHLLQRPELVARARATPELLKQIADEVLRFDYFVKTGLARYALEDVELHGVTIKKGQLALLSVSSALRDGAVFSKPNAFEPQRPTYAHLGFGHGIHYCLGVNLARLEVQVAVGALFQRFPAMRLMKPPSFGAHAFNRKMEVLEVQLRP